MTNAQVDEINELLKNHSETLSAFYDEGIRYGLKLGLRWMLEGIFIGFVLGTIADVVNYIIEKH